MESVAGDGDMDRFLGASQPFDLGTIVAGKVIEIVGDQVVVDIGYKSEGLVPLNEWDEGEEPPQTGDPVEVLLEGMDDDTGEIVLSRKKAHRMRAWEMVISKYHEGDVVTGTVTRKIKGGLLVDIGVNVFLPASQVDIRRPSDIGDYIGQEIQCMILKIDEGRRNIVVSPPQAHRGALAGQAEGAAAGRDRGRPAPQRHGQEHRRLRRVRRPRRHRRPAAHHRHELGPDQPPQRHGPIDDQIEVMVLHVDKEREKIALGLKQKTPSPWENVADKYPVGTRVRGEVVNVMSYGAFVKLEEGIEGLVHISEMSWTKRINHPSELVNIGDKIEVVVLGINKEKQEISLGMKQTQANPWDQVAQQVPARHDDRGHRPQPDQLRGLHRDRGRHRRPPAHLRHELDPQDRPPERGARKGPAGLLPGAQRRSGPQADRPGPEAAQARTRGRPTSPSRYEPGDIVTGKVTKLTNFGVFVELEPGLEGLLHISELADHKVDSPEEVVKVGDEIEVKILRVDRAERKIGLSRKKASWSKEDVAEEAEAAATGGGGGAGAAATAGGEAARAGDKELKGGLGGGGPLFSLGGNEVGAANDGGQPDDQAEQMTEVQNETPAEETEEKHPADETEVTKPADETEVTKPVDETDAQS